MKQLRDILAKTSQSLEAFTHPRVSIAWQDVDLVYRRVHNPSADVPMDIIGKKLEDLLEDKAQAKKLNAQKRQVIQSGRPFQELLTIKLSGKKHIFDFSIEPTFDQQGKLDGLISISIDVTDLVDAREKLKEANGRLMKLLDETLKTTAERPRLHSAGRISE